jgi:hypothetical protein
VTETVELLAERAPNLHETLRELPPEGFVILDGTLIATDRIAADEPYYSMKHRRHEVNVQAVAAPDGTPCGSRGRYPATCSAALAEQSA